MSSVFLLDLNGCTGCEACRLACTIENELDWGQSWRHVSTYNELHHPDAPLFHISHACNHCEKAPCERGCPTRAIRRDEETGALLIHRRWCIGCGYCRWACPYDAPLYDEAAGVMTKCTLCRHRLAEGLLPACVDLCPTGALRFGESSELGGVGRVEGFPDRNVNPAVRFVPLRRDHAGPPGDLAVGDGAASLGLESPAPCPDRGGLRAEWPLAVFTQTAAILVGWFLAHHFESVPTHAGAFLGAGILAMVVSTFHLGQWGRPWLALLGLRRSWISREIVTFVLFLGIAATYFLRSDPSALLGWAGIFVGAATLFCIDRVYDPVVPRARMLPHSADTLLTALLLFAVLGGNVILAGILIVFELALYSRRKLGFTTRTSWVRISWSVARIGIGLLAPVALWFAGFPGATTLLVVCLLVGQCIDRCELYADLEPFGPVRQMARDLARRLGTRPRGASSG